MAKDKGRKKMDASPPVVVVRFNKFLPYWAVFQTDLRQTRAAGCIACGC